MRILTVGSTLFIIAALIASGCSHGGPATSESGMTSAIVPQAGAGISQQRDRRTGAAPNHVLTWLILDAPGGPNIDPSKVVQWVNYTMTKQSTSQEAHSLGMKTILYTDPNRTAPDDLMHTSDESTYAHDCNGNRIKVLGKDKELMDPSSQKLWTLWPWAVQTMISWDGGGIYDYIFEDTADSVSSLNLSAMPCNFDQNNWTQQTNNLDSNLGYPIVYNGLSHVPSGTETPAPAIGINPTSNGGMAEDCYVGRTPTGYHYAPNWLGMENTELAMFAQGRLFVCHGNAYVNAGSNDALRMYFYASYLLSYDLGSSVVNTEFLTPSGVTIMPEVQLVPEQPLVQEPSDISGLQQASGVYGREYSSCFLAGAAIGACAVAVNPNNPGKGGPLAFPWPNKYTHTLTMSGSGAYDGGTVATNGPPPPNNMSGGTAVIAFP